MVITIQTLEESLKDEGVEKIQPAPGNVFEDHLHEAIEAVNDPQKENGEIVEVVLAGWKLGDTIIRPAKVKVNRKEK